MGEKMATGHRNPTYSIHNTTDPESTITLQRSRRGHYRSAGSATLKNNLLAGVGYLELANAGDFAANVWNEIPVPRHATILMAIGGPIALLASLVAARDFYLSWGNISLLYAERKALRSSPCPGKMILAVIGVNTRELGTELIDRMLMDLLLGFGALLVGTGTIMAIWGADHQDFEASNLLSGFIGNGFAAVFGVVNAGWSAYLVYRFQIRYVACRAETTVDTVRTRLRERCKRLQWHAIANGVNGLVAGMASMVTAKMWWGYVVLVPCVILMIAVNLFWKLKLGYDRPVRVHCFGGIGEGNQADKSEDVRSDVLDSLASVLDAQATLPQVVEAGSLHALLSWIINNGMLELFCVWVARMWPNHPLFDGPEKLIHVKSGDLLRGSEERVARMASECRRFLEGEGRTILEHRERYLLELVGEVVWREQYMVEE